MLIGDAVAAILWIGLHDDDLNAWYLALLGHQGLPGSWFIYAAVSIVLSVLICFVVFPLQRKHS